MLSRLHTESFFHFWFQNNESIIQWTTLAIIVILLSWITSFYFYNGGSKAQPVEHTPKKVAGKTRFPVHKGRDKDPTSPIGETKKSVGQWERKNAQIDPLNKELEIQTKDSDKTAEKIKSLEKKLAEYEIIEKDIVNLSRYKEENKQLKKKLTNKN